MEVSETRKREIDEFATWLSWAKKPDELGRASTMLRNASYGVRATASFRICDPDCGFPVFSTARFLIKDYVVPYLYENYVYVMQHERLLLPSQLVDHAMTFDSNFASYVDDIVREKPLEGSGLDPRYW